MENQVLALFQEAQEALKTQPEAPALVIETRLAEPASLEAIGAHWHGLRAIANPRDGVWASPSRKEEAKRKLLPLFRWLLFPLMDNITGFHARLIDGLGLITERLRRHEHRQNELTDQMAAMQQEIQTLRNELKTALTARVVDLEATAARHERTNIFTLAPDAAFHFDYPRFEWKHRGSRELIKDLQIKYVECFRGMPGPVLDCGAGRGEFIELLRDHGIAARGIELDGRQAAYCRDRGLDVATGDLFERLAEEADESLGGIFLGQVIEHISPSQLIDLIKLAGRKLAPGGCFLAETPNPQCLFIFSSFFYLDPTHSRPVHPEMVRYLLEVENFSRIEIRHVHPLPDEVRLEKLQGDDAQIAAYNRNVDRLNSVLYYYQDYAAIAYK